jgi:ferrous iron transport protein A
MTLAEVDKNQTAEIIEILESEVMSKLYEFGILPGQIVQVVERAPFRGPIYLKVEENLIAIRLAEAKSIIVKN